MTTTTNNQLQADRQPLTPSAVSLLYTREINTNFAGSPTDSGTLAAHVNRAGQTPVASRQELVRLHWDPSSLPYLFDEALELLVDLDGWPSDGLTTEDFGAKCLQVARQATR